MARMLLNQNNQVNQEEFKGHETFVNVIIKTKEGNIKVPFQKLPEGREVTGIGIDSIEKCYRTCNSGSQYYLTNKILNLFIQTVADHAKQLEKGEGVLLSEIAPKLYEALDFEIYRKGEPKDVAVEIATEEDLANLL